MIDIEDQVYKKVKEKILSVFKGAFISGEYVKSPARFPAVFILEEDNSVYEKTSTNTIENHSIITYRVYAFSNKAKGKKSECKAIIKNADDIFSAMGFTRINCESIRNLLDSTVYQMIATYTAVVSKDETIYRR